MKKNVKRWLALMLAVVMVLSTCMVSSDSFLRATDGADEAMTAAEETVVADETEVGSDAVTPDAGETEPAPEAPAEEPQEIVIPQQEQAAEGAAPEAPAEEVGDVVLGQEVEVIPSENAEDIYNVVFHRPAVEGGTLRVWTDGSDKKDVTYTDGKYVEEVKEGTTLYFEIETAGNYLVDSVKDQKGAEIAPTSVNGNISSYKMVINENKEITIMYRDVPAEDEGSNGDNAKGNEDENLKQDAEEEDSSNVAEEEIVTEETEQNKVSDSYTREAVTFAVNVLADNNVVTYMVKSPIDETETPLLRQNIPNGEKAEAPSNIPEFEGYRFVGWVDGEGNNVDFETPIIVQKTVYTKYIPVEKYVVTIHYLYSDGKTAITQPYVAEVKKGEKFEEDVKSPVMDGFTADREVVEIRIGEMKEDVDYQVIYTGKPQEYRVSYRCDDKDVAEPETLLGEIGMMTQAEAKEIEGFTAGEVSNYILGASDENPEIVIEYTRNRYTVSYDTGENGSYVKPESYAFDENLVLPKNVTRPGYTFDGWKLDGESAPTKMPAKNIVLTAEWKAADTASYTVVYWQEKVPGTYDDSEGLQYDYESSYVADPVEVGSVAQYNQKNYEGFELDTKKSNEEVTVAADGSTVKRVYYNRKTYTISFYHREWVEDGWFSGYWEDVEYPEYRITAQYGEDISSKWEKACAEKGWGPSSSGNTQYTLFANMPAKDLKMYEKSAGTGKKIIYQTERLDGTYEDHATFNASSGVYLTEEDKQPIEGFTFYDWKKEGSSPLWLKYTRNSYSVSFEECKNPDVGVKFEDNIFKYLPQKPTPKDGIDSDYVFDGWYYSPSYKEDTRVKDGDKMPAHNVQVFAKWVKPSKKATLYINNEEIKETVSPITVEKYETIAEQLKKESDKLEKANENYEFTGWYTDEACTKPFVESTKMTEDIDLYAGWKRVGGTYNYTVQYIYEDGDPVVSIEGVDQDGKIGKSGKVGETVHEIAPSVADGFAIVASKSVKLTREGIEIVFTYRRINTWEYTVKYVTTDGKPLGEETKTTSKEVVVEHFKAFEGYKVTGNLQQTLSKDAENREITFVYAPFEKKTYTVEYYQKDVSGDGYTKVDSEKYSDWVGAPISVSQYTNKTYQGFTFEKVEPKKWFIVRSNGENVIKVYYTRNDQNYTVKHVDKDTEEELIPSTSGQAKFGQEIAGKDVKAEITGYKYDSADPNPLIVGADDEQNVITVYYTKRTDLSYTVKYLEQGTEEKVANEKTVGNQTFGTKVTENAIDVAGYNKVAPTSQTITIDVEGNEIIFYYTKRNDLSYTVNYLEKDTNTVLAPAKTVGNQTFGTKVTENAIKISGYNTVDPSTQEITIAVEGNVINFYYTKKTDLSYTVKYLEVETDKELAPAKTVGSQTFGEEVTEEAIDVTGYDKVEPTTATITIEEEGNVINFYYTKRSDLSYTVNYLEKDTDAVVAPAKTVDGQIFGDKVTENAIDVAGYDKVAPTSKTIEIKVSGNEINFYYTKRIDLSYTVNYLEKDTDKVLADAKTVDNQTFETVITSADEKEKITGYTYDSADPEKLTVGVDENVINLYYTANDQTYTVNYLEKGTDKVLKDPVTKDTKYAVKITGIDEKETIPNYLYDSVDPVELTIGTDNGENVINVYYVLDENGPDGKPDEIPDSEEYQVTYDGNGGTMDGKATYTDPKIYPAGYDKVKADSNQFTKENAKFAYWKRQDTGERVDAGSEFAMPENGVTLVAQWEMLSITKKYSKPDGVFKLGDRIDFTIEVTSSGEADLTDSVRVTDAWQNAVIDVGNGYDVINNTAVIPAGMKAGSTITVNAYYIVTTDEIGKNDIVNTATATTGDITVDDATDPIPMDDVDKQITINKTVTNLDEATGTDANGNKVFALGNTVKFDIEVKNTGNQDLSDIVVTDELEDATIIEGKGYDVKNNTATIGSLKAGKDGNGESVVVKAQYTIQEKDLGNSEFRNTATAKAGDDTPGTGTTDDPIPVDEKNPEFTVEKNIVGGQRNFNVGQTINYTITVTNTGNMDLNDVEVTDQLQGATGQVTFKNQSGVTINGNVATINNLPVGATRTLNCSYVVTRADANSSIRNVAIVNGTTPDPTNPDPDSKRDETEQTDVENLYNLTINYVYATGGTAAPSVRAQYLAGESFSYTSPSIAGYTPDYAFVRTDAEGMPPQDVVVTIVYTAIPVPAVITPVTPTTPGTTPTPTPEETEEVGAMVQTTEDGEVEVVPVVDEEVPLANRDLDEHKCCILHFLLMLAAMLILAGYTHDMKKRQKRIAELAEELETELLKREQEKAE